VLGLISFICVAEENIFDNFNDLELSEYSTKGFFISNKMSEERRCGDFTELVGADWNTRTFTVLNTINKGKAIVTVIQDSQGPLYCVKQIRLDAHAKRGYNNYLIGHLRDVVASYVFESMGIRYNKVRIIPASVRFPGKYYPDKLATLHTFAPGSNKTHDFPYSIHLEQYLKARFSARDRGLTMRVINDMSQHDDLPPMVAGNTFVSNPDQSGNNMFWDARTERWTGIDMELAYKLPLSRNLSEVGYYQIDKFLKTPGFSLSRQQFKALEYYNAVLQGLLDNNHPNDICQLLKNIAEYAHVAFSHKTNAIRSDHSLQDYYEKINAQYNSSKKLVKHIDLLLQSLRYVKRRVRSH
jgi:hypothetical protein